jgi:hypothetical protein
MGRPMTTLEVMTREINVMKRIRRAVEELPETSKGRVLRYVLDLLAPLREVEVKP